LEEENYVNQVLLKMAAKLGIACVAGNSVYYHTVGDHEAQDALVCVREGEFVSKPKKYIGKRGREFRFGLPNDQYYLKSPQEMFDLFKDIPSAIANTQIIADSCEEYKLSREVLLPKFDIPQEFTDTLDATDGGKRGENNFLRHLTYEGAKKRYEDLTDEIKERLDFELQTIANTGYPGYLQQSPRNGSERWSWPWICGGERSSILYRNHQCRSHQVSIAFRTFSEPREGEHARYRYRFRRRRPR
jgi:DNA polymerase-3 subunit alpha